LVPLASIGVAVIVANFPALLHLVTTNPLVINADLTSSTSSWLPGSPYIDPNAGYTTQALGHLAVLDWFHGHIPWWNPFEGVGSPLAGEMQSGAFFPLTIVLAFHQGMLFLQLALEALTGWSTYFLVRRLGVGRAFSTAAGVAFGLCGTYAWLAHAPIRPVALLPLCLLGVERAIDAAKERKRGGWRLLAVALALSILAGFPETTFIDALLVAWWSVLRIAGPGRRCWRPIIAKLAGGAILGASLAAPLMAAFVSYLPYANVGGHNGAFAYAALPQTGLVQTILPYSLGPIFGFHSKTASIDIVSLLWSNVGGFLTVTLIASGLVGLLGKRQRILRLGLGAWILICLLRTYGFPPVVHLMALLPGVRLTAFFRYSDPSWELAVVVLAALGLDDIARHLIRRRMLVIGATVTGLLSVWAAVTAWPILTEDVGPTGSQGAHRHIYDLASLALAGLALTLLVVGGLVAGKRLTSPALEFVPQRDRDERTRRRGRGLMAAVVCVEAIVLLGFTAFSAPRPVAIDFGPVSWLQANLGPYRFVTLEPIQPNYGSYFGIGEANINDIPFPKTWNAYVDTHLDTNTPPGLFTGFSRIDNTRSTPAEELATHLSSYEAVGVRYVVEPSNGLDVQGQRFPPVNSHPWPVGPRLVYHDRLAEIWQLPTASPAFSLKPATSGSPVASGCTVTGVGWDQATVTCPHRSVLVRKVQFMSGWTAAFDGSSVPVRVDRIGTVGLFQEVAIPPGKTTVHFTYLPTHETVAFTAAIVATLIVAGSFAAQWIRRRRRLRANPAHASAQSGREHGRAPDIDDRRPTHPDSEGS